jgi:hypothetical protein
MSDMDLWRKTEKDGKMKIICLLMCDTVFRVEDWNAVLLF